MPVQSNTDDSELTQCPLVPINFVIASVAASRITRINYNTTHLNSLGASGSSRGRQAGFGARSDEILGLLLPIKHDSRIILFHFGYQTPA